VRYRLVCLTAIVVVATGCGGSDEPAGDPGSSPAATLTAYLDAARAGDSARVEKLVSSRFKARTELTGSRLGTFVEAVREAARRVGDEVVLDKRLGDRVAVVGVSGTAAPGAFAAPLVRENGVWRVEPYGLDLVYGEPPANETLSKPPAQVWFAANLPDELKREIEARVWVDGRALDVSLADRPGSLAPFAARAPALEAGRHTVVAFAQAGDRVAAIAWAFTIAERS
jgi:hypothetical protein